MDDPVAYAKAFSLNELIPKIWADVLHKHIRERLQEWTRWYEAWWNGLPKEDRDYYMRQERNRSRYRRYTHWVASQPPKRRKSRSR